MRRSLIRARSRTYLARVRRLAWLRNRELLPGCRYDLDTPRTDNVTYTISVPHFNPHTRQYLEDPYPALHRLRASEPVHWSAKAGAWIVTSFAACQAVLQDDDGFSSDPVAGGGEFGEAIARRRAEVPLGDAPIMGNSDPPEHTRLRAIVNRGFVPRAIESMRPNIERAVDALLEEAPRSEPFEVMTGLAQPLAVATTLQHLGFPRDSWEQVRDASLAMMRARAEGAAQPEVVAAAGAAREAMLDYLARLAESRERAREGPRDVLAVLFEAMDDEAISANELLMMLIHISLAGNGPTSMSIGNALWVLSRHPEHVAALRSDPAAIPAAVEELLRFEAPTHYVARFARKDVRLGARTVRAGQQVHVMIAAANRDPARFPNPDTLDFARADNRHLTFGYGIHFCLGAPLARLELEIALRKVLERFGAFSVLGWERGGTAQVRGLARLFIAEPGLASS